jgi:hypothetical protein
MREERPDITDRDRVQSTSHRLDECLSGARFGFAHHSPLTFEKACSMGLRSGEQGGR